MRQADVIVIGAGVLGTFHAYFAAQKGCTTLLIERNAFPNDASTRNFGIIAQSLVDPASEWAACARATRDIYRSIQQRYDISVQVTGSLYLASTDVENAVLQEFALRGAGDYRCTYLDAHEALSRYPFIQETYCTGALLFPDDLTLDPRRMLRQLIPYVVQTGGVQYVPHTTAVAVEPSGRQCRVKDARGDVYVADRVIICSGADYRTLFPDIIRTSGLQLCKLQMMQTAPLPRLRLPHAILSGLSIQRYPAFTSCPSYGLLAAQPIDEDVRAYGIHLLFKQAADGSVVIGDSHEYRDWTEAGLLEETTNCAINEAILRYARKMLRLPSCTIQAMWNGYYLVYPGHDMYTKTIDGTIHIVTGAGKGMTIGPGFAQQHIESVVT